MESKLINNEIYSDHSEKEDRKDTLLAFLGLIAGISALILLLIAYG